MSNPLDSNPLEPNPLDPVKSEGEHDPHYEPVIRLTDKVEVKTHEEDEEPVFTMRAKLFRFDTGSSEWKERGTGNVRLLAHKTTGKVRLVMRREIALTLCANHSITADMKLQPNIGSDRARVWKTLADMADGEPSAETLAIRFANAANAEAFEAAFNQARETNVKLASGNTEAEEVPAAETTEPEAKANDEAPTTDTTATATDTTEPAAEDKKPADA